MEFAAPIPELLSPATESDAAGTPRVLIETEFVRSRRGLLFKRLTDWLLGLPLFLASIPLLALFALFIAAVNPGAPFYSQEREGCGGRRIRIWKLRTMHLDAERVLSDYLAHDPASAEEWRRFCKLQHDPRILPVVGRLLRRTSLDELPQLWNVLKGEMTLVGPRPLPRYHLELFPPEFRALRRDVLPGLTGLWQVTARGSGDIGVQQELDTHYIRNWSILMDIKLLCRTVWAVLSCRGAW